MFNLEYSHTQNINWFDRIKNLDEFLLWNIQEPTSLYPLLGDIKNDYHSLSANSIYFHISSLKNKKIHIVSPDVNYLKNFESIKKILKFNSTITLHSFPWYFLNSYFLAENLYEKNDVKLDILYKAIFLSGQKKLNRLFIIKELKKYDKFLYSNPGNLKEGYTNNKKIEECTLKNNKFYLKIDNILHTTTGDFDIEQLKFKYDDFDTNEKIYFTPLKNNFKYIKKIDFNDTICAYQLVPEEYFQSAISLFSESQTIKSTHLTEKTIKNFYYKKAFFAFACQGYYDFLVKNNFVLYDELFNYSLDHYDYEKRLLSYVSECKKILELKIEDLIYIISKIDDKIEHNYQNCKKISEKFLQLDSNGYQACYDDNPIKFILEKVNV